MKERRQRILVIILLYNGIKINKRLRFYSQPKLRYSKDLLLKLT